jgi:hypothetical protein
MAINEAYGIPPDRNVEPINLVQPAGSSTNNDGRKKEPPQPPPRPPGKKVRDYFHPLNIAVEATNRRLLERRLPYRFKVYKKWGEVYIDLTILDEQGNVKETQRKNISHDDFNRIIDDVASVEGLFFDHTA